MNLRLLKILLIPCLCLVLCAALAIACSSSGDDDDDDDDDNGTDCHLYSCSNSWECAQTLGPGWCCNEETSCCEFMAERGGADDPDNCYEPFSKALFDCANSDPGLETPVDDEKAKLACQMDAIDTYLQCITTAEVGETLIECIGICSDAAESCYAESDTLEGLDQCSQTLASCAFECGIYLPHLF